MKPPPTTTARFGFIHHLVTRVRVHPRRSAESRSSHSRIFLASGTVLTEKIPGRSIPGSGGRIGAAPGDNTSLSYFSW